MVKPSIKCWFWTSVSSKIHLVSDNLLVANSIPIVFDFLLHLLHRSDPSWPRLDAHSQNVDLNFNIRGHFRRLAFFNFEYHVTHVSNSVWVWRSYHFFCLVENVILIIDDKWYCFNRVRDVQGSREYHAGSCTCTEVTVPGVTFT